MKSQDKTRSMSKDVPSTKRPKVFVGLSGGVDSAVSAALLKQQGFDVTGVFIKAWSPPGFLCTWKEDRRSAMRVAAVLDIPFITLDLEKEYKQDVVDYMIKEYKEGKTPNPDVMCNKEIKFGYFLKFALANSADYVATGHYAQLDTNGQMNPNLILKTGIDNLDVATASLSLARGGEVEGEVIMLKEGKDKNKDQSYFLWTLTQDQLKHILFPIGHLEKQEVRKIAEKFGLPQATRKDSQGLCFLGKIEMKDFLKDFIKVEPGLVLNENGEAIGFHKGALLFTIGERHGFNITKKEENVPLYVVAKDLVKNTITVSPKKIFSIVNSKNILIKDVNWISGEKPDQSKKYSARIRYRQSKAKCFLNFRADLIEVIFDEPQFGVSPGQSIVVYDGEVCLGGGVISG